MHSSILLLVTLLFGCLGAIALCIFWLSQPRKPAKALRLPATATRRQTTKPPPELAPQQFLAQQLATPPAQATPPAAKALRGATYAPIHTLLTPAEQSFLSVLREAAPDHMMICPQVRLANLIHPTARSRKQNQYDFYRIQAKCVDFVLCDETTTAPRLVVELDDRSHDRPDRQTRDAFVDSALGEVGLPILHVRWQRSYDPQQIREAIRVKLNLQIQPLAVNNPPPLAVGWLTPIATEERAVGEAAVKRCRSCLRDMPQAAVFCPTCGVKSSTP